MIKLSGEKKRVGWAVDTGLREYFNAFCQENRMDAEEAAAGAVYLFMQMPPLIQQLALMEVSGRHTSGEDFWHKLRETLDRAADIRFRDIRENQK